MYMLISCQLMALKPLPKAPKSPVSLSVILQSRHSENKPKILWEKGGFARDEQFSFSYSVSKDLYSRRVKIMASLEKG